MSLYFILYPSTLLRLLLQPKIEQRKTRIKTVETAAQVVRIPSVKPKGQPSIPGPISYGSFL